jgi:hypothetical protein
MDSFTPNVSIIQQSIVRVTVLNVQSCDLFIKDIQDPQEMRLLHPDLETAQHTCEFLQDALQGKDSLSVLITKGVDATTLNFTVTRETKYNTKNHTLTLVERSVMMKQQSAPQQTPNNNNNNNNSSNNAQQPAQQSLNNQQQPTRTAPQSQTQSVVSPRARVESRGMKGKLICLIVVFCILYFGLVSLVCISFVFTIHSHP